MRSSGRMGKEESRSLPPSAGGETGRPASGGQALRMKNRRCGPGRRRRLRIPPPAPTSPICRGCPSLACAKVTVEMAARRDAPYGSAEGDTWNENR